VQISSIRVTSWCWEEEGGPTNRSPLLGIVYFSVRIFILIRRLGEKEKEKIIDLGDI